MARRAGLILAGGQGIRYGGPKALARTDDGDPWLSLVGTTLGAVVDEVVAVIPAGLSAARELSPAEIRIVEAPASSAGLSDSLRAGLDALDDSPADAVVVTTVDLPTLPLEVLRRVLDAGDGPSALSRAVYTGRPGHPVVIGRRHWPALLATLEGDTGAGPYLRSRSATSVECGDLFDGQDIDIRRPDPSD